MIASIVAVAKALFRGSRAASYLAGGRRAHREFDRGQLPEHAQHVSHQRDDGRKSSHRFCGEAYNRDQRTEDSKWPAPQSGGC